MSTSVTKAKRPAKTNVPRLAKKPRAKSPEVVEIDDDDVTMSEPVRRPLQESNRNVHRGGKKVDDDYEPTEDEDEEDEDDTIDVEAAPGDPSPIISADELEGLADSDDPARVPRTFFDSIPLLVRAGISPQANLYCLYIVYYNARLKCLEKEERLMSMRLDYVKTVSELEASLSPEEIEFARLDRVDRAMTERCEAQRNYDAISLKLKQEEARVLDLEIELRNSNAKVAKMEEVAKASDLSKRMDALKTARINTFK